MAKKGDGNHNAKSSARLIEHIKVIGFGKGSLGERFVKLRIKEGERRRWVLLRTDNLHGGNLTDQITRLNQKGAHLISARARTAFMELIQKTGSPEMTFRVATRPGFHGGSFVLPDIVLSDGSKRVEKYLEDLPL